MKLRDDAAKHPEKTTDYLAATSGYVSPEAKQTLEKKPSFKPGFIQKQAEKFGLSPDKVEAIAAEVVETGAPIFAVAERREFSVDDDVRERFTKLYNEELARRRQCPRRNCDAHFTDLQQVLVHWSLHLLFEADNRTQKMMWEAIRELNYPTQEKGLQAVLPAEERKQLLRDPLMRARLRR